MDLPAYVLYRTNIYTCILLLDSWPPSKHPRISIHKWHCSRAFAPNLTILLSYFTIQSHHMTLHSLIYQGVYECVEQILIKQNFSKGRQRMGKAISLLRSPCGIPCRQDWYLWLQPVQWKWNQPPQRSGNQDEWLIFHQPVSWTDQE